jgi:hypothetical protein
MAKRNGGIIGKVNTPTTSTAGGVWRLQDQYNARKNDIWPSTPYSVDFFSYSWRRGRRWFWCWCWRRWRRCWWL